MEMTRLFIVWLLVLVAYLIINPPMGKARAINNQDLRIQSKLSENLRPKNNLLYKNLKAFTP